MASWLHNKQVNKYVRMCNSFIRSLHRLPLVPSSLPPRLPCSTLTQPTVSSWDSCGHPSDQPCCQKESTEPYLIISARMMLWLNSKLWDAETLSVEQMRRVGVYLWCLRCICTIREKLHDIKHHSVWKLDFEFFCEWHSSAYDLLTISAAQPYDATAEEESKCNTGHQHQSSLPFSSNIRCLVFPRGDITRFKPARWAYLWT